MSDLRSYLDELKRRKVVRTAIAYCVVAGGVLSIADILWEHLPLPPGTMTVLVALAIIGLPVVLVLEWVFEISREGLRRNSDSDAPESQRSSMMKPVAIGALVLGIPAVGIWQLRPPESELSGADAPLVESRLAILPCEVYGAEAPADWSKTIVFVLSDKLKGTAALQPLDPHAVVDLVDDRAGRSVDPAELARTFAAGHYLRCSVQNLGGDRVRISTRLYRTDSTGTPVADPSAEGRAEDASSLVEEVAVALLTSMEGTGSRLARDAGAAEGAPLEAWLEYVEGYEAHRSGRWDEAMASFRDAVAIDSTFALGHYRLWSSAGWAERLDVASEALDAASSHVDRLSPHYRDLVRAAVARRDGRHAAAKRLYRDITLAYPDHIDAWYQLGEVLFHQGWLSGEPVSAADAAFSRAAELDAENHYWEVLFHQVHIAGMERDHERFDSLVARLETLGDGPWPHRTRVLFRGDSLTRDSLMAAIAAGALSSHPLDFFLAELAPTPAINEDVAKSFTGPGQPDEHRVAGFLEMAGARVATGRWQEAADALDQARALRPALTLETEAYLALAAVPELVQDHLQRLAVTLEAWDGEAEDDPGAPALRSAPHGGLHPWLRLYLLGLVEARLGWTSSARERADDLAAADPPPGLEEWLRDLETVVRAEAARSEGESGRALALLEDAPLWVVYRLDERSSPILGHFYPVFLRAELLRELGRPAEALTWYEALRMPFYMPSDALSTRILLGEARARDAIGDAERARELRSEIRERWRGPPQPLAALMAGGGSSP